MGCCQSWACCGSKSKTDDKKKQELTELDIKKTKVETLDTLFDNASSPFNEAVDLKEKLDDAISQLKKLAGYKDTDTLKDVFLGLKKRIPNLKLELTANYTLKLTTGTGYSEDVADIIENLIDSVSAISDLVKQIQNLLETAVESAKGIIEQAETLQDTVKDANLNPLQMPRAVKNTSHNVLEFKKVDDIVKAFQQFIDDMMSEMKEIIKALDSEAEPDTMQSNGKTVETK
ncbi:inactive phospholipase C-like protein 1 [Ptychodera flava]|uniref:inactive phospholipase C-like protein 1 n=1 Tax=Ptychodera flava TaxID=63121 RepID=UPI00396A2F57